MGRLKERSKWVSYLRVSTPEQAERELSLPAQRHALNAYAERAGHPIDREYVEAGCSGTNMNRKAVRQMLEDVLSPGSKIGVIGVAQLEETLSDVRERIGSWELAASSQPRHDDSGSNRLADLRHYEQELCERLRATGASVVAVNIDDEGITDRMREAWSVLITSGGTASRNDCTNSWSESRLTKTGSTSSQRKLPWQRRKSKKKTRR